VPKVTIIDYQLKQREVVDRIEEGVNDGCLNFSTISPVENYEDDPRTCLTSVHLPRQSLLKQVQQSIIKPLSRIEPDFYYYPPDSLHMTIKNIRVSNDPPQFNEKDIRKAEKIFSEIIPNKKQFNVYFYRLLLFPNNLALIGTTDPELDNIILDLDKALEAQGIPDDKVYINSQYFFSNMTLARFNTPPSKKFKEKVNQLSAGLNFKPYRVDSVTLLTCNPVFKNRQIKKTWHLLF